MKGRKPLLHLLPSEALCAQLADPKRMAGLPAIGAVLVGALKAGC